MILRGIIDSSLNGQLCLRGFAPIKELERISKADYKYQRNPIEGREDIIDFLEKETYLFFPEIIMSFKFKHDFSKGTSSAPPIQTIQQNKKFKSNVDNTELRIRKVDYKSQRDSRGTTDIRIVELDINDAELERLIEENNQPFQRIDGNHRLRAAEKSNTSKVKQMVAPFCILLGEEFYDNGTLQKNKETQVFDKSVKVFFHNINTKTIPLTSEQNLKVIIDDKDNFPNDELKQILGGAAVRTRELIAKENPENFSGIAHIIQNQYRSYYIDVFRRLIALGEKQTTLVKKVFESLQAINVMYNENDNLKANSSFGLLTAFLYYHVQGNKAKFLFFKDWVLSNHIFEVEEIKAESLISIFDKIAENNVKIFVAMPFFSPEEVESYNNTYNKVIDEIIAEYPHLNIERPLVIMQQEGKTFNIISDITNKIRNCSIFIADLSEINVNVIYELGFARSLKKPSVLVCREDDFGKIPFDIDQDLRRSYKANAHSTLEAVLKKDLIAILKDDFGYIADKKDDNAK